MASSVVITSSPKVVCCALIQIDQYQSRGAQDIRVIKAFVFDDADFMNSSVDEFNKNINNMQKKPIDPFLALMSMIPIPETVFKASTQKLLYLFKERKTLLNIEPNISAPIQKHNKI